MTREEKNDDLLLKELDKCKQALEEEKRQQHTFEMNRIDKYIKEGKRLF